MFRDLTLYDTGLVLFRESGLRGIGLDESRCDRIDSNAIGLELSGPMKTVRPFSASFETLYAPTPMVEEFDD